MKTLLPSLFICVVLAYASPAFSQPSEFSFGVIAHAFKSASDESVLRDAIVQTDADNLAFVVANGIKSNAEPCDDQVYNDRKSLLNEAKNGLILSLAASDWADCKRENGRSAAMERLNRLRDVFFTGEFSFGGSKIPMVRQSTARKFRSYGENARWEFGDIMFATINLPANNNHYLAAAGRNSEFEDRLIANRDWLQRIFAVATRKKLDGIVLFCDGDPLSEPSSASLFNLNRNRDGFSETRRQITTLAAGFHGKVLIVHGQTKSRPLPQNSIAWRDNLGDLEVASGWVKFTVNPLCPCCLPSTAHPRRQRMRNQQGNESLLIVQVIRFSESDGCETGRRFHHRNRRDDGRERRVHVRARFLHRLHRALP
jgi:hypothetical protein